MTERVSSRQTRKGSHVKKFIAMLLMGAVLFTGAVSTIGCRDDKQDKEKKDKGSSSDGDPPTRYQQVTGGLKAAANWTGDNTVDAAQWVKKYFNKATDDQKVSLKHGKPVKKDGKYVLEIVVVIAGTKSGTLEKTYSDLECTEKGELTDEGNTKLKEAIEKDKKEFQALQW
jgi:hypothetical protein